MGAMQSGDSFIVNSKSDMLRQASRAVFQDLAAAEP
jgi:hypothetical protein